MFGRSLEEYLIIIPAVLIALTVHEMCHGYAAYLLGDDTAKSQGRLSFNPIDHIDPIGLLCMIFFGFGWAKPVPVNLANLKNRKVGMSLVALAGPLSNFVLAFVCLLIVFSMGAAGISGDVATALVSFLVTLASLSVGLGVFNLLPVPPLDGSNIIYPFMPHSFRVFMYNNGYYIQFALLILLYFGFLDTPLIFLRELVMNGMLKVLLLIF